MNEIISYIIDFLLGENNEIAKNYVGYGASETAKVIIKKSNFFDENIYLTGQSIPTLPLKRIDGIPILFGENYVEEKEGQLIIYADLIASTYFLISRYEECVRREIRDKHGRFLGRESILYRAGVLNVPVVEQYGVFLRNCLRKMGVDVQESKKGFSYVYLTHDVDQIWTWDNYYRAFRTTIKRLLKGEKKKLQPLKAVYNYQKYDPCYTFKELIVWDKRVINELGQKRCKDIYFMKACEENKSANDIPYWDEKGKVKTQYLMQYLKDNGSEIGLHISYDASTDRERIKTEKLFLENQLGHTIEHQRNHYLASREPEDFRSLLEVGIKEDFTMGYADVVGFRLGTCRSVRWIDPVRKKLTDLILHPMTVMECTLDGKEYMNIQNEEEAFKVVREIICQVYDYNGEIVLLWHNTSVANTRNGYQRSLYRKVINMIINVENKVIREN